MFHADSWCVLHYDVEQENGVWEIALVPHAFSYSSRPNELLGTDLACSEACTDEASVLNSPVRSCQQGSYVKRLPLISGYGASVVLVLDVKVSIELLSCQPESQAACFKKYAYNVCVAGRSCYLLPHSTGTAPRTHLPHINDLPDCPPTMPDECSSASHVGATSTGLKRRYIATNSLCNWGGSDLASGQGFWCGLHKWEIKTCRPVRFGFISRILGVSGLTPISGHLRPWFSVSFNKGMGYYIKVF